LAGSDEHSESEAFGELDADELNIDDQQAQPSSSLSTLSESLLVRIADLYEHTLSEPHEAIASHQELLSYLPARIESNKALIRLFEQVAQWSDLVISLENFVQLEGIDDNEKLGAYQSLASVLFNQLERYEESLPVLSTILELAPNDEHSIAYLEQLVQTAEFKAPAARLLSPYYEQNGQVEHQIYTLNILAEEQDDSAEGLS
jgi:tetratricopeptide (TPR) repeat protein